VPQFRLRTCPTRDASATHEADHNCTTTCLPFQLLAAGRSGRVQWRGSISKSLKMRLNVAGMLRLERPCTYALALCLTATASRVFFAYPSLSPTHVLAMSGGW